VVFDCAVHDPAALAELPGLFAPDATVQLYDTMTPVVGIDAITAFYREILSHMTDSRHFWDTVLLDDGRLECRWVSITRRADGLRTAQGGVEHAALTPDGRIAHLRNRRVDPRVAF
jgi:hypothetical protein